MIPALALAAAAVTAPVQLDSQIVIQRYARTMLRLTAPKVLVFSYTVSQAGPTAIEQTHRIYRSGELVRDETLLVDGAKQKTIRISRYRNRYTLSNLAPRLTEYTFLFEGATRSGSTLQYAYKAVPNAPSTNGFAIDGMVIDGKSFLPSLVRFHTVSAGARGDGTVTFVPSGAYWVPQVVNIEATLAGKSARERITFSGYRFPLRLPKSTFQGPRPLPSATPPAF
ncbi:MAG TPA: hypothetical protein VFL13_08575 [Candidatus Baltobacteraceae bacterium]|nr:hypothetical protein [Candidatus Baltobacteraceae bacterium]